MSLGFGRDTVHRYALEELLEDQSAQVRYCDYGHYETQYDLAIVDTVVVDMCMVAYVNQTITDEDAADEDKQEQNHYVADKIKARLEFKLMHASPLGRVILERSILFHLEQN
ncbi:MAG: hypothetical protein WA843_03935 [Candidatus Saccharimonadales bacterium]